MNGAIGIFDSGLGGLTVLKHLTEAFPHESFVYLGDIARLPYGNKSPETIRRYGVQILEWLRGQNVKALIIACNSASSVFLGENSFQGLPLLNVIEPGARAALDARPKKIAVLGTSATIRSHAYRETIKKLDQSIETLEIACPLFVPLVEEGIMNDEITRLVIERYLAPVKNEKISTIILGCTHYPLLKNDLKRSLGEVNLVESGEVLSAVLGELFKAGTIPMALENTREIRVCITDLTDHFERLAYDLMGKTGIDVLEKVVI
jgi:glutamate racemase